MEVLLANDVDKRLVAGMIGPGAAENAGAWWSKRGGFVATITRPSLVLTTYLEELSTSFPHGMVV